MTRATPTLVAVPDVRSACWSAVSAESAEAASVGPAASAETRISASMRAEASTVENSDPLGRTFASSSELSAARW